MPRLERISIQGFKSFANKTVIPLPEGFNVIAGPNGSGKSNITDAIIFVLGISSARHIRAQKLQNLIFNGSPSRKAADFCEVSIYLDNSDQSIPGEDKEVKITRKITRSGISIYKVNGKTINKTAIIETLLNAKLTPDGYNILMQGDVTKVIEMNDIQRREIIDDISGISEFDDKKEKAVKELEKVDFRVKENSIMIEQKQMLVEKLKKEKETAEKHQKLESEMRKLKASLFQRRLKDLYSKMEKINKGIDEKSGELEKLNTSLGSGEESISNLEEELKNKTEELVSKSKNYEIKRKLEKISIDIVRKNDKINANTREIESISTITDSSSASVKEVLKSGISGIYGVLSSLITTSSKYSIAIDVALGSHKNDVVVDNHETAIQCINYLKQRKLGRARFLPLDRISSKARVMYDGDLEYAIDLVEYDKKYFNVVSYTLGSTLIANSIDIARSVKNQRIATLDGDLIERDGAMIGGFFKTKKVRSSNKVAELEKENSELEIELEKLNEEKSEIEGKEEEEEDFVKQIEVDIKELEKNLESIKGDRRKSYDEREILQKSVNDFKIEKAKLEASIENNKNDIEEYKDVTDTYQTIEENELETRLSSCVKEMNELGPINDKAIYEYESMNVEFLEVKKSLDGLIEEKKSIMNVVEEVEKKRKDEFMKTFENISKNFEKIYKDLTSGFGRLRLEDDIDSGMIIEASPKGKKILNINSMSGGEKTLTSMSFLFSIMEYYGSPFYVLDEIDAALDKENTNKIVKLIKEYSSRRQFIVISHNDYTLQESDKVFGVSMDDGVSKVISIKMPAN